MAMEMSSHSDIVIVFDVKCVILECIYDSLFSLIYIFMWHQLHSKQYMRLLLWHVPLVIVL